MSAKAALSRLAISGAVAVVLLILLLSGISQPVKAQTRTYNARFTDISGLHGGADVRVRGVLAGRVLTTALQRQHGQSVASVEFTLDKKYGVVANTRIAVKYQTLTGVALPRCTQSLRGLLTGQSRGVGASCDDAAIF